MKTKKRLLGDSGEVIASNFLVAKGFVICGTNYQKPWGEIDIIAKKGRGIHFVEVKTQTISGKIDHNDFYEAEENVTYKKRQRLRRVIQTYLIEKRLHGCDYWVDVIAVYVTRTGEIEKIEYIEDILL